jgi:hypothetical protein
MEFAAAAVIPRVPKPESSCLRDIPLSRYCLIRCFIVFLPLPSECSSELDNAEFSVGPLFRASYASRGLDSTNLRAKAPPPGIADSRGHPRGTLRSIGKGLARQGIEPWSTDYETAALPLSYRATGLRFDTTFLSSFGQLFGSLQDFTPCDSYGSPSSFRTRTSTPVPFRASANSSGFDPR